MLGQKKMTKTIDYIYFFIIISENNDQNLKQLHAAHQSFFWSLIIITYNPNNCTIRNSLFPDNDNTPNCIDFFFLVEELH